MKARYPIQLVILTALLYYTATGAAHPEETASRSTSIRLTIEEPSDVLVAVVDPAGRHIRQLCDDALPSGQIRLRWDGNNEAGEPAPPGAYFVFANGRSLGQIRLCR